MHIQNMTYYRHEAVFVISKHNANTTVILPYELREGMLYTDGTHYIYMFVDEEIVTDFPLFKAMCKLAPVKASVRDVYFAYLDAKYPVYSYH